MLSTGVKYHLFAGAVSKLTLLQAKFRNGWYVTIHASLRFLKKLLKGTTDFSVLTQVIKENIYLTQLHSLIQIVTSKYILTYKAHTMCHIFGPFIQYKIYESFG